MLTAPEGIRAQASACIVDFLTTQVLPLLNEPQAVLLVGSYAEGNANLASDIDLIVLTPKPTGAAQLTKQEYEISGLVVSIDYLTIEELREEIRRLDELYRSGRYVTDARATRIPDAIIVYDTGVARPLIEETKRYEPSAETLHEVARVGLTCYQDVLGSLDADDPATAVLMARQAANLAVECFLLAKGMRSLKPKWHLRRLERAGANGLLKRYRRVLGIDESLDQTRAAVIFAELDRLFCEALEIDNIQDFERSPLWSESGTDDRLGSGIFT